MKYNKKLTVEWYKTYTVVQKCTADRGMERVPFHDREMGISIQYHVMLIRQSNDQILMRCYIIGNNFTEWNLVTLIYLELFQLG